MHGACPAGREATTVLGSGHLQLFAQHPKQGRAGVNADFLGLTVYRQLVTFHETLRLLWILRTGHSCIDPSPRSRNKLLVGKRRQRALSAVAAVTGLESPEHQRFLLMMSQYGGTVEIVILRAIGERAANVRTRQDVIVRILPLHRQRSQVPI